jgi:hypothetical protein
MRRILLAAASLALMAGAAGAQTPVKWTGAVAKPEKGSKANVAIKLTAKIDDTWHIYSITSPPEGPMPTRVSLPKTEKDFTIDGKIAQSEFEVKFDDAFGVQVEFFEKEANFTVPLKGDLKGKKEVEVHVRYMVCNNSGCLPATTEKVKVALTTAKK